MERLHASIIDIMCILSRIKNQIRYIRAVQKKQLCNSTLLFFYEDKQLFYSIS